MLLTGVHVLEQHALEANLPALQRHYAVEGIDELIALKIEEKSLLTLGEVEAHLARAREIRARLDRAFETTTLPEKPANAAEIGRFLVETRMTGVTP